MNESKNPTTDALFYAFFGLVIIVSMSASFGFGVLFIPYIAPSFLGEFQPMASGIMIALLADGGTLLWQYIRVNRSHSEKQMAIAGEMSRVTIGAAILITVVFLILTNYGLVANEELKEITGQAGLALVIGLFGWSFFRVWSFIEASPEIARKEKMAINEADFMKDYLARVQKGLNERKGEMVETAVSRTMGRYESNLMELMQGEKIATNDNKLAIAATGSTSPVTLRKTGKPEHKPTADNFDGDSEPENFTQ